jgi:hypothetical protein
MNKITIRQLTASTLFWLAACVVVGLASNAAYAQGTPNKLESIDVQNLAGQQVQLTLASHWTSRTPRSRCRHVASTCARAESTRCWPPKPRAAHGSC